MSASIKLRVAEPCSQDWHKMEPAEQGRFCLSCQKQVVDFTLMSDKEMVDYFSQRAPGICGRFMPDQLERSLALQPKKNISFAYFWNVIVAALLTGGAANAQSGSNNKKAALAITRSQGTSANNLHCDRPVMGKMAPTFPNKIIGDTDFIAPAKIAGRVVDEDGLPIAGATIMIKGTHRGTVSDSAGNFSIECAHNSILAVSSVGYQSKEMAVDANNSTRIVLHLSRAVLGMGEVVVIDRNAQRACQVRLGGVTWVITRVSTTEKLKRTFSEWTNKKDVVIFPNPAPRGTAVQMALSLKEVGQYTVEVIGSGGELVHREQLNIIAFPQTIHVQSGVSWAAGVYHIRVTHASGKKYFSSLVLQ